MVCQIKILNFTGEKIVTAVNQVVNHVNLPVFLRFSGLKYYGLFETVKYEIYRSDNLYISFWYFHHYWYAGYCGQPKPWLGIPP